MAAVPAPQALPRAGDAFFLTLETFGLCLVAPKTSLAALVTAVVPLSKRHLEAKNLVEKQGPSLSLGVLPV